MDHEKGNDRVAEFRRRLAAVDYNITLPDSELEVMMAVWNSDLPVTSRKLMTEIGDSKGWKTATLISFLLRLEDRGFLMSFKDGKERNYIPVADRELYLAAETERFCARVHGGSFVNLLESLFFEKSFTEKEADSLAKWLKSRYEE